MQTVPIPEPAPERVRRFDLQANRWRWWLVDPGQWADDEPTHDQRQQQLRDAIHEMTIRYGEAIFEGSFASTTGDYERATMCSRARARRFKAIMRLTRALAEVAR